MKYEITHFYDDLSASYHLIFEDWERSILGQADALADIIHDEWGDQVLDVSCGIGTQTIGLALKEFSVTTSDISSASVSITRAQKEASVRTPVIDFSVCDMRSCYDRFGSGFELVIACDNAIPHLPCDAEILIALRQMHDCLKLGGGVLLTVRDYGSEPRGRGIFKPYGVREIDGRRIVAFQVWDFEGDHYDLSLYLVEDKGQTAKTDTQVYRTRYYAISTERLCELMTEAGFTSVKRLDGVFYQPVLVGSRP